VSWPAERTDEFDEWWETLTDPEQRKAVASIEVLEEVGPSAGRPLVDSVEVSKHANMKELRVTKTIRVFFAFDHRRVALLLIGGDKAGKTKRFYRQMVSKADKIYDAQLRGGNTRGPHGHGKTQEKGVQRTKRPST
jgi:hypothetical protein